MLQPEIVHIKARPVPHRGIPFQAVLAHQKTEVVPFSFDERDKEMFARKEEKIKTVLEEEKKVFVMWVVCIFVVKLLCKTTTMELQKHGNI